jgi:hypothetical protein
VLIKSPIQYVPVPTDRTVGPSAGVGAHRIRGYALPVSSPASDGLHRTREARPQGDPSGIITAEHFVRALWGLLVRRQGVVRADPGSGGRPGPGVRCAVTVIILAADPPPGSTRK